MSSNGEFIGKEEEYQKVILELSDEKLLSVLGGAIKAAKMMAKGEENLPPVVGPHCLEMIPRLIGRELVRRQKHNVYVIER